MLTAGWELYLSMTKRKKRRGREEGYPPPYAVLVSAHFFFHRLLHQNACMEQAIVALLVCDRKKEGHQNYDCLIRGSRPEEIIVLFARF